MEEYIKIKEFAELTGVSVRTLQYYDEINLLKPAHINEYGHRFYDSGSFFIKDLNFCLEKKLSARDKRAIKCIKYWKKNILEANQVTDDMIRFAEEFYQKNPANTFGITEGSYKYLVELIDEYDKI